MDASVAPAPPAPAQPVSAHDEHHHPQAPLGHLALAALGIIYGDIGTSPLYTLKECFFGTHGVPTTQTNILGILSLVFWSLIFVVSIKYILFVLRADNKGEGGTFSLLAMLRSRLKNEKRRWAILTVLTASGASLLYGDGVITPAISVLSAIEGINMATDAAAHFVVPLTCVILGSLFFFQRHGTAVIGKVFGPVMTVWFATLGVLGLMAIVKQPLVLSALNPVHIITYFSANHLHGTVSLASVVLCITGCEALYADMGHFGRLPIRLTWYLVVLPGLLLNYFGQGAYLLMNPESAGINPFFALAPKDMLYPLVFLATFSTIIASQAMISGVYSLTQQAIQLGFIPRMRIVHTSEMAKGQIYIPTVNWMLMIACLTLVLVFEESDRLAAAYGFAVTASMTITSTIYFQVTRIKWNWPLWQSLALLLLFLLFDSSFLASNIFKVADGGWITICIATVILAAMITWRDGRAFLAKHYELMRLPTDVFLNDLAKYSPQRTSGTAVFMSIHPEGIPHTLLHHLKHNEALHERVLLFSVLSAETPTIAAGERVQLEDLGQGFYRVKAYYGFMESPNIPRVLELLGKKGLAIDIYTTSFFLGRETLLPTGTSPMAKWRKHLFIFMARNSWNATSFFKVPPDRVVELGNQVEI
ncbi:potassium transporter Kup [Desulfobulbus sp.]|uniref:potassium transporter Kup n=1 Tax=Desulfobulbus sp. TaxID=895 RepID=UPI00286F8C13|nr:potassium transporter Kup [Desulfobulbus sp.]